MSELLLVSSNNGITAVMRADQYANVWEADISNDEMLRRRDYETAILSFTSRSILRRWPIDSPRFSGIAGTDEDLSAILMRYEVTERSFYVPFSNGPVVAEEEFPFHAATWEIFHQVFSDEDWTFKFGRRPNWLNQR